MQLITQGKTNWKFLLIVVVLATIVGGGIRWFTAKQTAQSPEIQKDIKYCMQESNCILIYSGSDTCPSCLPDEYQCVSTEYYNKVLWPEWERNHKGIVCEGCPMITEEMQCICEKNVCKKVEKDETANWQTYRNEEYGFEIEYPGNLTAKDWAFKTSGWDLLVYIGENKDIGDGPLSIGIEKGINTLEQKSFFPFEVQTEDLENVLIGEDNYSAKKFSYKGPAHELDEELDFVEYFIEQSGYLYQIHWNRWLLPENIFNQILSTFRFIDNAKELTIEELKNAEYYVVYGERIQLKDGHFSKFFSEFTVSLEVDIYNERIITFGDLNNDGAEDAVVVLTSNEGGTGNFREMAIMLNQNGSPNFLTSKDLGDRVVINSINIQSGIITLDMIVHAPGDGLCCPTLNKTFKYKLSKNQLVEITD